MMRETTTSVSKGTIARTAASLLVVLNLVLRAMGRNPLEIEEGSILALLEVLIETAIIVVSWWYNNSLSPSARRAQAYLEALRDRE